MFPSSSRNVFQQLPPSPSPQWGHVWTTNNTISPRSQHIQWTYPSSGSTTMFMPPPHATASSSGVLDSAALEAIENSPLLPPLTEPVSKFQVDPSNTTVGKEKASIAESNTPTTLPETVNFRDLEARFSQAFSVIAKSGLVPVAGLSGVLAVVGIQVDEEEVRNAIKGFLPDAMKGDLELTLEQAIVVLRNFAGNKDAVEPITYHATVSSMVLGELLASVVVLMILSTGLVAGLAVMWLWLTSDNQSRLYTMEEMTLLKDMLQVMVYNDYTALWQREALEYATIIATLVETLGYRMADETGRGNLDYATSLLGQLATGLWQVFGIVATQETAAVLGTLIVTVLDKVDESQAGQFVDLLNNLWMPVGQELQLGVWNNLSKSSIRFLTQFRYYDQCSNNSCSTGNDVVTAMAHALNGGQGVLRGVDYRSQTMQAAYLLLPNQQVGLVYSVGLDVLLDQFIDGLIQQFDGLNAAAVNEQEVMLGRNFPNGTKATLTAMEGCDSACKAASDAGLYTGNMSLARALRYEQGIVENVDYRGIPVIAAYVGVPEIGLGISVKISRAAFSAAIVGKLSKFLDELNANLPAAQEMELATSSVDNGIVVLQRDTDPRYACPTTGCSTTQYMETAAATCASGVMQAPDYRGMEVIVGYACASSLSSYVAYKVDVDEVEKQGVALAVQSVDALNRQDTQTTFELEIGQANAGIAPNEVKNHDDFTILTQKKYPCPGGQCSGATQAMLSALQGFEGLLEANDYRNVPVLAAVSFLPDLQVGLVAKVDVAELTAPVVSTGLILVGVCVALLVGSTAILVVYTLKMVKSMFKAERECQEAIMHEKERFGVLVKSMYPTYVLPKVLAGDRTIVQAIPRAAVFFSDVFDFSTVSNRLSSEELLDLLGYIYRVMDGMADYFSVTKVKTVGDGYVAVCGLPGAEGRKPCVDMLDFASCCAQVFSVKFDHPAEGDVLRLLTDHRHKKRARTMTHSTGNSGASEAAPVSSAKPPSHSHDDHSVHTRTTAAGTDMSHGSLKARCIMSYGIAYGPITAGVLLGKCPMFDIWGKTVNLASRMQSTGVPGRIQVSQSLFHAVVAEGVQSYDFEEGHDTLCKGFGLVKGYFVLDTTQGPPEDLLKTLNLEPNLGLFMYTNPVADLTQVAPAVSRSSATGGHSAPIPSSHPRGSKPHRAPPAHPKDHLRPDPLLILDDA